MDGGQWYLVDRANKRYALGEGNTLMGRSGCDILLQSKTVEPQHVLISFDRREHKYKIKDLKSVNGTFVNDKKISSVDSEFLYHGDSIRFGYDPMIFHVEHRSNETGRNVENNHTGMRHSQEDVTRTERSRIPRGTRVSSRGSKLDEPLDISGGSDRSRRTDPSLRLLADSYHNSGWPEEGRGQSASNVHEPPVRDTNKSTPRTTDRGLSRSHSGSPSSIPANRNRRSYQPTTDKLLSDDSTIQADITPARDVMTRSDIGPSHSQGHKHDVMNKSQTDDVSMDYIMDLLEDCKKQDSDIKRDYLQAQGRGSDSARDDAGSSVSVDTALLLGDTEQLIQAVKSRPPGAPRARRSRIASVDTDTMLGLRPMTEPVVASPGGRVSDNKSQDSARTQSSYTESELSEIPKESNAELAASTVPLPEPARNHRLSETSDDPIESTRSSSSQMSLGARIVQQARELETSLRAELRDNSLSQQQALRASRSSGSKDGWVDGRFDDRHEHSTISLDLEADSAHDKLLHTRSSSVLDPDHEEPLTLDGQRGEPVRRSTSLKKDDVEMRPKSSRSERRRDGGRHSMKLPKNSPKAPVLSTSTRARSGLEVRAQSMRNSRSTVDGRPPSPRSAEMEAWKRRKSYDPRKAAAAGKKTKSRKQRTVDDGQLTEDGRPPSVPVTEDGRLAEVQLTDDGYMQVDDSRAERKPARVRRDTYTPPPEEQKDASKLPCGDMHDDAQSDWTEPPLRPGISRSSEPVKSRDRSNTQLSNRDSSESSPRNAPDSASSTSSSDSQHAPQSGRSDTTEAMVDKLFDTSHRRPARSTAKSPPARDTRSPPARDVRSPPVRDARSPTAHEAGGDAKREAHTLPSSRHRTQSNTDSQLSRSSADELQTLATSLEQMSVSLRSTADRILDHLRISETEADSGSKLRPFNEEPLRCESPTFSPYDSDHPQLALTKSNLRKLQKRLESIEKATKKRGQSGTETSQWEDASHLSVGSSG